MVSGSVVVTVVSGSVVVVSGSVVVVSVSGQVLGPEILPPWLCLLSPPPEPFR